MRFLKTFGPVLWKGYPPIMLLQSSVSIPSQALPQVFYFGMCDPDDAYFVWVGQQHPDVLKQDVFSKEKKPLGWEVNRLRELGPASTIL